jgi:hypothetical protein
MAETIGTYVLGEPKAPSITHDNGFLDKNKPRAPGVADYASYWKWRLILEAAESAQGLGPFEKTNMPDALAAYRHFLKGNGAKRYFSYERYVSNDNNGKTTLSNMIGEAQNAAVNLYRANARTIEGSFKLTGSALGAGSSVAFPYPATENWQKAIGGHNFWISADVTVTPVVPPSVRPPYGVEQVRFTMVMTVHVEDMYNFNPGQADIATSIPDAENGQFEITGLGQQYINWSTLQRSVTWVGSNTRETEATPLDDSRQRKPSDNRRLRNRT